MNKMNKAAKETDFTVYIPYTGGSLVQNGCSHLSTLTPKLQKQIIQNTQ